MDLSHSLDNEANDESLYWSQLKDKEAAIPDIKTILMAILKYNDGKRFVEGSDAPLPQSEDEVGFRSNGKLTFRYEELPALQKQFEILYITRMQIIGQQMEQQKALKVQEVNQRYIEAAKPQLNKASEKLAAKQRVSKVNTFRGEPDTASTGGINTVEAPRIRERKEKVKQELEQKAMGECTFAPKLTANYKQRPKTPVRVSSARIDEEKPKQEISIANVVEVQTAQERLYKLRVAQKNKRDKAKEDYEYEKQAEECTFAPNIITKKPLRAAVTEKTER